MNFNKFINSDYLKTNPLCGIDTYRDELNLATGACTRIIKKFVLTGEEPDWGIVENYTYFRLPNFADGIPGQVVCSHYISPPNAISIYNTVQGIRIQDSASYGRILIVRPPNFMTETLSGFKTYLQQQYAKGTPVTVWYVLANPTTETITVPSGLSGTEEGYLIQDGTPTPTNPIYPTANTVEKWFGINRYIMGTSTDTITTLPADIYADGNNATVGISGNTVQSGTPTPDNPIMPQGTGDKTGNLFDKNTAVYGEYINEDGTITYEGVEKTAWLSDYIPVTAGLTYTLNQTGSRRGKFYKADKTPYQTATMDFSGLENKNTFTIPETVAYIRFTIYKGVATPDVVMLSLGSTALPYEPYGVKIPILSANTTTPVYLGEVQTTRRVKKLVFDGTENFAKNDVGNPNNYLYYQTDYRANEYCFCTHLENMGTLSTSKVGVFNGNNVLYLNFGSAIMNAQPSGNTVGGLKEYLAAQYANGTPVTVWYVLAEPETGIVNEPLMKIGDYADEVSGITIPTITGKDTFDVDTTLKPSEVTANYHGWHTGAVHERDSGQWE